MCRQEFEATKRLGYAAFSGSCKWFSANPEHITTRIMQCNGFNIGKWKNNGYEFLCEFEVDASIIEKLNENELQLRKENARQILFCKQIPVKYNIHTMRMEPEEDSSLTPG